MISCNSFSSANSSFDSSGSAGSGVEASFCSGKNGGADSESPLFLSKPDLISSTASWSFLNLSLNSSILPFVDDGSFEDHRVLA